MCCVTVYLLRLLILWCLSQVVCPCEDMEDRKKGSKHPKAFAIFTPDDDSFARNSTFTITCKVSSSDKDDRIRYPKEISVYIGNSMRIHRCPKRGIIPYDERTPENTCSVNYTIPVVKKIKVYCMVLDHHGKCTYSEDEISIKEPKSPAIREQKPRYINATEGQSVNLTCAAYELPRPNITWYKDGNHVLGENVTWYRGKSTLMLGRVGPSAEGNYWCEAENSLGKARSNETYVTVFSPPKVSIHEVKQTVALGTKVILTCSATGYPLPTIGWIRDGEDLGTGELASRDSNRSSALSNQFSNSSSSVPSTRLTIGNRSVISYVTQPSVKHSKASSILTMTTSSSSDALLVATVSRIPLSRTKMASPVTPSSILQPFNTVSPSTVTITPNATILSRSSIDNTTTTSTATPRLSVIITKKQPPTKRPFSGVITQNGRQSTLLIKSVSKHDQGRYRCYARNHFGNGNSSESLLYVLKVEVPKTKPRFKMFPRNIKVSLGSNVFLNCSATGSPVPNITWYHNNSHVTNRDRITIETADGTSVLHITRVTRDDEGMYVCFANNTVGVVSSKAFLSTKEVSMPDKERVREDTNSTVVWYVTGSVFGLFVVIAIIVFTHLAKKRRSKSRDKKETDMQMCEKLENIDEQFQYEEIVDDQVYLRFMGMDRDWELPRDRLQITNQKLGSGCFGNVFLGVYTRKDGKDMKVAVKMLQDTATSDDRKDILAELEILKHVGRHPNIVSLVGAYTLEDPICIVIELIEGGSLHDLLRNSRTSLYYDDMQKNGYKNVQSTLNERDLVKIALDVAKGMHHLHKKECIHRDLAARNVLIRKNMVAKISDFGLARSVPSEGYYVTTTGAKVPWKWMSPEALRGLFTNKSDVWSFGILLWEIATFGDTPYPGISQVISLYNLLVDGKRLEKPPNCDELLYGLMTLCWSPEADSRPEFKEISNILQDMLNQNERVYINLIPMDGDEIEH